MAEKPEIDARLIIEAQGAPKEKVEEAIKKLISALEEQEGAKVYEKKFTETEERDEFFSNLADVGMKFKDFETLLSIVLNFGPSAIVVNSPQKVEVSAGEIQNIVGDVSAILHTIAQENAVLKIQNRAMFQRLREAGLLDQQQHQEKKPENQ
ncbi:MAG: hypothetical protein V1820_02230 [archaeon]